MKTETILLIVALGAVGLFALYEAQMAQQETYLAASRTGLNGIFAGIFGGPGQPGIAGPIAATTGTFG